MHRGAIVVGAHANGLGVIRALAPLGIPIVALSTRRFDMAHHSRWVSEHHALPGLHERLETLVEFLETNASRWAGWTVFPTNDDALTALARHHERLSRTYRLPLQPWETIADLVDKDRMQALAERVGLELPRYFGPATAETIARGGVTYPAVVKPIQHDRLISSDGAKLYLVRDEAALLAAATRLEEVGLRGLVFEFVPGPDSNLFAYCVYVDARGEPSPGVTVRKLRQNPPAIGGARAAEIVPEIPVLRDATLAILHRAGFHGMAFAEFKLDPRTGRYLFIEVNGRPVLYNSILPPTGIDLVRMAWSEAALGETVRPRPTGWSGVWIHLQADLYCSIRYRRQERLTASAFLGPYRRPKTFAVWSASDPKPFLAQTALAVRGALGFPARGR